ncbi:Gas vesicle synthesis protein GvpL/GvpF [Actinomadura rubteroloni]|uniref:Gas vesicle synthesis protein GvpL/GvpF n=1 Tax=Actinomadura rubteroloni TaxID=1926885 RepID=A0A2P4UKU4_9ACTN|nr:GvpL/GvpF family gas vesicle protein [Actinomadura rubteroloni]POM25684.1 Gas vesicle synthesis protein GvpL/GvpF [Actinomadura rubteroloni]
MSTYVYGLTRSAHPLKLAGAAGVGAEPAPLRAVRADGVAAVVSDAPEGLRPKRRDLEAHEAVLEALMADGTVLPMRFGTLSPDDATLERELNAHSGTYAELLSGLDGRAEYNIKAAHHEDAVLREILRHDAALREANEALRAADGGSPRERMDFGERVAGALEGHRERDAARLLALLRPHAVAERPGPPVDGAFLNMSLLVDEAQAGELTALVETLRGEIGWLMELNLYGPLPPYSFVDVAPGT